MLRGTQSSGLSSGKSNRRMDFVVDVESEHGVPHDKVITRDFDGQVTMTRQRGAHAASGG